MDMDMDMDMDEHYGTNVPVNKREFGEFASLGLLRIVTNYLA